MAAPHAWLTLAKLAVSTRRSRHNVAYCPATSQTHCKCVTHACCNNPKTLPTYLLNEGVGSLRRVRLGHATCLLKYRPLSVSHAYVVS